MNSSRAISVFFQCIFPLILGVQFSAHAFDIPETKSDTEAKPLKPKKLREPQRPLEGIDRVGHDIQKFGEDIAQRIDRIIKKKTFEWGGDPWTMQGIPIILPSPLDGFNLGLRLQLQNIRRQDPHLMEFLGQSMVSDLGRYKHMAEVDFPHAFQGTVRVKVRLAYDRDISHWYFGIGNAGTINAADFRTGSPLYLNTIEGPSVSMQFLRYFSRYFRAGPVLGLRWTQVSAPAGSLLLSQNPLGISGGNTHYVGLAFIYDTLDFEPYPSRGNYHELFLYGYGNTTASDYNFFRATYTFRKFIPLHRRLTLAHRTLFEALGGDVPYYELFAMGGSAWTLAFGSNNVFRGYETNQFVDRYRLVAGFELRWDPIFVDAMRQDLTIGFVPFLDIGRVWPQIWPLDLEGWHLSAGWGARLIWNSRLVIRFDTAITPNGFKIALNLNNTF